MPQARDQVALPVFWNGGSDDWVNLGGWSPTPLDIDNILLFYPDNTLSSNYFLVNINSGHVGLAVPITATTLTLSSGAQLSATAIAELSMEFFGVSGSSTLNDGLIQLHDSARLKTLTLTGSGEVVLDDLSELNGLTLHGSGHTVSGEGTVNALFALDALVNEGTFNADRTHDTLRIAGVGLVNSSLLTATNGGRLKIETPLFTNDQLVDANGGVIDVDVTTFTQNDTLRARNGGSVQFSDIVANASGSLTEILDGSQLLVESSTLDGGTYRTVGTGLARFTEGTSILTGVLTLEGGFLIDPGALQIANATVSAPLATLSTNGPNVTIANSTLHSGRYAGLGTFTIASASTFAIASASTMAGDLSPATIDTAAFAIPSGVDFRVRGEIKLDNAGGINFVTTAFNGHSHLLVDGDVLISGNGGAIRFGVPSTSAATSSAPTMRAS